MKKALYIIEYDNFDETTSEWFVDDKTNDYNKMEKMAYKSLKEFHDLEEEEIQFINVYKVSDNLIKKVYESK